jgi:hypothetical protein
VYPEAVDMVCINDVECPTKNRWQKKKKKKKIPKKSFLFEKLWCLIANLEWIVREVFNGHQTVKRKNERYDGQRN